MPRRFNYTGRKHISKEDAKISVLANNGNIYFSAEIRLDSYRLSPEARVFVEAYRGASTSWKRFDFGRVSLLRPAGDLSLNDFGIPDGILFRIKVISNEEGTGRILAEADRLFPKIVKDEEELSTSILSAKIHELDGELWRLDFADERPLLLIDPKAPGGVEFARDALFRALVAPAILREILSRILAEKDPEFDDEDHWHCKWIEFAERLPGVPPCPIGSEGNLEPGDAEGWINLVVTAFAKTGKLVEHMLQKLETTP
jgi:hypothetical protein